MATKYWVGGAPAATSHVVRFTPTVSGTNAFTITAGNYSLTVTPSVGNATTLCSEMLTALGGATVPVMLRSGGGEVTWTNAGTYLEATSASAGGWFKFTASATGGDSWAIATQTESTGPNILTDPKNWSSGTIPGSGDTLVFHRTNAQILYDLDAWASTTFAAVYFDAFSGLLGLPYKNTSGYAEYRPRYFKCGMTACTVGLVNGLGVNSGLVRLDTSNIQTNLKVMGGGTPTENGVEAVVWKGTHAANVVTALRGTLGIATERGDAATVATLNVGYIDSPSADVICNVGPNVTLTTINAYGGLLGLHSSWSGTLTPRAPGRMYIMPGVTVGTIDTAGRPLIIGV